MKRTDLIKALNRLKIETGSIVCLGCGHEYNCTTQGCAIIREAVKELEAADIRPVVRGRWVKAGGSFVTPGGDPVWECSECGKGKHVYGIEHGTYGADVSDGQWVACPNCGARMDG